MECVQSNIRGRKKDNPVYGIIYKIKNIENGKIYIGQTIHSLGHRRWKHKNKSKTKRNYFYDSIRKYGWENFEWSIIDQAYSREEIDEKEKDWIWFYNSTEKEHGYNNSVGGRSRTLIDVKKAHELLNKGLDITNISKLIKCDRGTLMVRLRAYLGEEIYKKYTDKILHEHWNSDLRKDVTIEKIDFYLNKGYSLSKIAKLLKICKKSIKKRIIKQHGIIYYNKTANRYKKNNKKREVV